MENQRDKRDNGSTVESGAFELGIVADDEMRHLSNDKCCLALLKVNRSWLFRVDDMRLELPRSLKVSSSSLHDEISSIS
jgi:hypothetical protein